MQVILRPAAAADIEDAISWYERQRRDLGGEFLEAVNAALKVIGANTSACTTHATPDAQIPATSIFLRDLLPDRRRPRSRGGVHARTPQPEALALPSLTGQTAG
jgi:plasmid stabilization system protein ParE